MTPLQRLLNDRRAGVAPMFALLLVPIVGVVGAAIDYTMALKVRSQLLAAADSASIASVSRSSPALAAAGMMTQDGAIASGATDARKVFHAQLSGPVKTMLSKVSTSVTKNGGLINAAVDFTANVPTSFMGIVGFRQITVHGNSSAANNVPLFMDFYLLLDNTPSMGVAATPADITKMVNNTPDQCAFACHDLSNPKDYYSLAKSLGVTMRIDVLRTATQQLMDTAKTTAVYSNQFRMAIYTFGNSATNLGLTTIQSLTSNLTGAKTAASAIDLMTVPYQNYADDTATNFYTVLNGINSAIPSAGDGTSSATPQKVLFFVSDGVGDRVNGSPSCSQPITNGSDPQTGTSYVRCQEPLDPALCTTLKNRGVKIAVLYTTYLPLPTNGWYNSWIAPFASQIGSKMQSCATPGLYFEVSPTQGISDAMTALFNKALAQARLTK